MSLFYSIFGYLPCSIFSFRSRVRLIFMIVTLSAWSLVSRFTVASHSWSTDPDSLHSAWMKDWSTCVVVVAQSCMQLVAWSLIIDHSRYFFPPLSPSRHKQNMHINITCNVVLICVCHMHNASRLQWPLTNALLTTPILHVNTCRLGTTCFSTTAPENPRLSKKEMSQCLSLSHKLWVTPTHQVIS